MLQGGSDFFRYLGGSKDQKHLVLGAGDTSKSFEIIEMRALRFSHKQIEKLLDQIEAEEFPRAFKHIISVQLP